MSPPQVETSSYAYAITIIPRSPFQDYTSTQNWENVSFARDMKADHVKPLNLLAPLPLFRVDEAPPFSYTGVDFAGPLHIKGAGTTETSKIWICLFTCMFCDTCYIWKNSRSLLKSDTVYDLRLAVILVWRFGGVVPEPPIIMSANNNGETAPWPATCFKVL